MSSTDWQAALRAITEKKHRTSLAESEARNKALIAIIEEREKQLELLIDISDSRPQVARIQMDKSKDAEATAFALATDWHAEETVEPAAVNGLNEFNLAIAEQRIKRFFQRVVRLTEIQRAGCDIKRLVLFLGGDLMTGYIHEELQESNSLSPTQTLLWLQDQIVSGIKFLQPHFEEIVVPCCYGNHGRNTQKPRFSTGAANSYEWMLYKILSKQDFGKGAKVTWHVSEGYHLLLNCYDKLIRFHHGDGLKYQGGIGGLTIPVEKAIAAWNKGITADLDVFGHWHQSQQNPKWVCNGSLIGFNAYSVRIKAPYELPSQTYFLFDKKRGRTITTPIFLDE